MAGMFIAGSNIIDKHRITDFDLLYWIDKKQLTAYTVENFTPVDWQLLQDRFEEIGVLCKKPGSHPVLRHTQTSRYVSDGYYTYEDTEEHERVEVAPDSYTLTNGVQCRTDRVPWAVLHHNLQNPAATTLIPQSQHDEIILGWNNNIKKSYALNALYKISELEEILSTQGKNNKEKTLTALLEEIGAKIPDDFSPKEKSAITKAINTMYDQFPNALGFCFNLAMISMPTDERKEWEKYTQEAIVERAKKQNINSPIAKQIYKSLPPLLKRS